MRWSTASAEKAELTGLAHGAGREDKGVRATAQRLTIRVHETEREGERAGEGKLAPTDRPQRAARERERVRERGTAADRRDPPVRQHGRAAWLGLVGRLGCFLLFFYSGFSNSFSISFSIGFSNPKSN
jgi:hypothetical protein